MKKQWGLLLTGLLCLTACSQDASVKTNIDQSSSIKSASKQIPSNNHLPEKIDHIVVVIEENHSQQEIEGDSSAPYMNSLMQQGANLKNYHAIEHPSQPNYLDLFSGSNQGVTNDNVPKNRFSSENLGSELFANHYTFAGYSEDLSSVGYNGASHSTSWLPWKGGYARKHNPWANFINVPAEANKPLTDFPTDFNKLPTVSFVIPNLENDMHDGSIKDADQWLKNHLDNYVQWAKTNNSLLIVTWDEDDKSQDNKIPTFLVGPMVQKGTYKENVNHYSLLRTIEDINHLPHAGKSESAKLITDVWK